MSIIRIFHCFVPFVAIFIVAGCSPAETEFYVSVDGSDSAPGTKEKPFESMEKARNTVRKLIARGLNADVHVYFRKGTYRIHETVLFGLEDGSGTHRITYQAYPGETVVFSSGLSMTGWSKPKVLPDRIPDVAKDKVWVMDLPTELRRFKVMYQGDELLPRARSEGFNSTKREEYNTSRRVFQPPEIKQTVYFPQGAIKKWKNLEDAELLVYPSIGWTMNILPLTSVDESQSIAKTTLPATYPMRYIKGNGDKVIPRAMYVENMIEFLDEPGEWVVDTQEEKVWYWPKSGEPGKDVVVPLLQELIKVEGDIDENGPLDTPVRNIHFKDFTFMHGERDTWKEGDRGIQHDWEMMDKATALVRFRGAEECSVEECRFTSSGGTGLRLDLHCQEITVTKCLFEDLGISGVLLCGYGPGTKDVNKNNTISNNRFTRTGELYWHGQALMGFQTGGNLISHNTFVDLPRKAIGMAGVRTKFFNKEVLNLRECASTIRVNEIDWNAVKGKGLVEMYDDVEPYYHTKNNIIEYNYCENVLSKGSDGAAINFTASGRGNIVRHNFIYNLQNPQTTGIRLDGHVRGTQFYNNILVNAHGLKPKPPENETYNNICIMSVNRTKGGQPCLMFEGNVPGKIERNVFYFRKDFDPPVDRAKVTENPIIQMDRNLYFCEEKQAEAKAMLADFSSIGYEANHVFADPGFVDIDSFDFRLREDSPLKKLGFEEITLEGIGITEDFPDRFR